ncbi:MAG: hypothetical protein CMJ58_00375 [Planctomycetaceae bacterium]|nr:hypothetical protein [Planctomycetaceae bacterium]
MFFDCPKCGAPLEGADCTECAYTDASIYLRRPSAPGAAMSLADARVELAILIDRTGSSAAFAAGVPASCALMLDTLGQQIPQLQVSVQSHGDEEYDELPQLLVRRGDPMAAMSAVKQISYGGGGDAPESHLSAVEAAVAALQWREAAAAGVRRVLVMFANAETKLPRSQRSPDRVGELVRRAGALTYLVCESTPRLSAFCEAAGGLLFPISNRPSRELLDAIARAFARSVFESVSTGSCLPAPPAESPRLLGCDRQLSR